MYRVMIVEDEMLVRLGIKNSIDWQKFNMEVIADVADGKTALDLYNKEKPDLIITDINMPVMDGMALISAIRKTDKETKIIILTCIEEFEVARKAVSLGVSDYILKVTMTEEEIEKILERAKGQMDSDENLIRTSVTLDEIDQSQIKEKVLRDHIINQTSTREDFAIQVEKLKLNLKPKNLILCYMDFDYLGMKEKLDNKEGQLITTSRLDMLDEILKNNNRGEAFCVKESRYVLIFSFEELISESAIWNELQRILNQIAMTVQDFFNASSTFGISTIGSGYASVERMNQEARSAMETKFIAGTGKSYHYNNELHDQVRGKINEVLLSIKESHILNETIEKQMYERIDGFFGEGMPKEVQIKDFFCELIIWITSSLGHHGDDISSLIVEYTHYILISTTLEEIISLLKQYRHDVRKNIVDSKKYSIEIAQAITYIHVHYMDNISLQEIAEHVNLNASYLSGLFKKQLNKNLTKYINELRIEKAKILLKSTSLKSYDIAGKVGFSDHTYFSKVFKKLLGMGPNEYRKIQLEELVAYECERISQDQ